MKNVSLFKKLALFGGLLVTSAVALISLGVSTPVSATSCVKGDKYTDFTGSYSGRDTMTVQTAGGKLLCNDVKVNFASFTAPDNYNGKGFKGNPTAIPQSQFYNKTVTLKKGTNGKTTQTVQVPNDCTNYQIDAYIGAVQTKITTSAGFIGTNAIVGKLFQKTKTDCTIPKVKACDTRTGSFVMVEKGKENVAPYTTDFSKCDVKVCDTQTGAVVTINKHDALANPSRYVDQNDARCKDKTTVCDTTTGKVVTVTTEEAKDSKYAATDDERCNPVTPPVTPPTIPSTGPTEVISSVAGIGALAGSTSMYIRSRRAIRK